MGTWGRLTEGNKGRQEKGAGPGHWGRGWESGLLGSFTHPGKGLCFNKYILDFPFWSLAPVRPLPPANPLPIPVGHPMLTTSQELVKSLSAGWASSKLSVVLRLSMALRHNLDSVTHCSLARQGWNVVPWSGRAAALHLSLSAAQVMESASCCLGRAVAGQ